MASFNVSILFETPPQFNAGCIAHIGIADIQGQLISQKGRQRI